MTKVRWRVIATIRARRRLETRNTYRFDALLAPDDEVAWVVYFPKSLPWRSAKTILITVIELEETY